LNGVLACIVTLLISFTSTTFADGPHVLPVKSKPFGQSYKEWVIDSTRWAYSIPFNINPVFNPAVTNCTLPQQGKVWFVATGGANAECAVPNGKAIFVHMGGYVDDYPCPAEFNFEPAPGQSLEEFLTLDAKTIVNGMVPSELYIDGKPVVDKTMLPKLRLSTGLFNFTGDLSLQAIDSCVTGKRQKAVADGWFAIIDGLKPGIHMFEFNNSKTGKIGNILKVTIGNNKVKDD
jgi:hypothetical protein